MGGNSPSISQNTLPQILSGIDTPESLVTGKAEMPFPSSKTSDQEDYNTKMKQQLGLPEVPTTAFLESGINQLARPSPSLTGNLRMTNQEINPRSDFASTEQKSFSGGK